MIRLLILISVTLALFGCSTITPFGTQTDMPDFNDTYILSNQPCAPPCWQGLTIGSSPGDEVLSTLSGLEFVDTNRLVVENGSFPDFDPKADWGEGAAIRADCKNQRCCVDVVIVHDRLRSIRIHIQPDDGLMLADAIESFGNPDYLYPLLSTGPNFDCRIEIIWAEKQMELYSTWTGHNLDDVRNCHAVIKDGILPKDLTIVDVYYLPIEEIHDRLEWREYTEFQGTK